MQAVWKGDGGEGPFSWSTELLDAEKQQFHEECRKRHERWEAEVRAAQYDPKGHLYRFTDDSKALEELRRRPAEREDRRHKYAAEAKQFSLDLRQDTLESLKQRKLPRLIQGVGATGHRASSTGTCLEDHHIQCRDKLPSLSGTTPFPHVASSPPEYLSTMHPKKLCCAQNDANDSLGLEAKPSLSPVERKKLTCPLTVVTSTGRRNVCRSSLLGDPSLSDSLLDRFQDHEDRRVQRQAIMRRMLRATVFLYGCEYEREMGECDALLRLLSHNKSTMITASATNALKWPVASRYMSWEGNQVFPSSLLPPLRMPSRLEYSGLVPPGSNGREMAQNEGTREGFSLHSMDWHKLKLKECDEIEKKLKAQQKSS